MATPFSSRRALLAADPSAARSGAIVKCPVPTGGCWYLFRKPPEITPGDLVRRTIAAAGVAGRPEVAFGFTRHGAMEFQRITKAEYERGQLLAGLHGSAGRLNPLYAQHNAVVLDGVVEVTPYIDYTDASLSLGISGGHVVINELTHRAADDLAIILRSGPLPFPLRPS